MSPLYHPKELQQKLALTAESALHSWGDLEHYCSLRHILRCPTQPHFHLHGSQQRRPQSPEDCEIPRCPKRLGCVEHRRVDAEPHDCHHHKLDPPRPQPIHLPGWQQRQTKKLESAWHGTVDVEHSCYHRHPCCFPKLPPIHRPWSLRKLPWRPEPLLHPEADVALEYCHRHRDPTSQHFHLPGSQQRQTRFPESAEHCTAHLWLHCYHHRLLDDPMFQPFRLKGLQQMSTKKLGCTEYLGAGLELQCCHPRGVDHPTSLHFCPTGWQQRGQILQRQQAKYADRSLH